jgi:hypothetical protein
MPLARKELNIWPANQEVAVRKLKKKKIILAVL